jgi:hypothetical protein
MQSHLDKIQLLPAIPRLWANGSVKGLKAMGNFVVDIDWASGGTTTAKIKSESGQLCKVYFKNIKNATVTQNGNPVSFTVNSDDEIQFTTTVGATYDISNLAFQVQVIEQSPVIADGDYEIYSRRALAPEGAVVTAGYGYTRKLIGIIGNSAVDGTAAELRDEANIASQQWTVTNLIDQSSAFQDPYVTIINKANGLSMTVNTATGRIYQSAYTGAANQRFTITATDNGFVSIVNGGKVFTISGGYPVNGYPIGWEGAGGTSKQWKFEAPNTQAPVTIVPNGTYRIYSRRALQPDVAGYQPSNKLIGIVGNATADATRAELRDDAGIDAQRWKIVNAEPNVITIRNLSSNLVLATNTTNSQVQGKSAYTATNEQRFTVTATDNGYIQLGQGTNVMEISGGYADNGNFIGMWSNSTSYSKQWKINVNAPQTLPVTLISYTVKAVNSAVTLGWKTATEVDNDYFILDRSTDGKVFTKVTTVPTKGNNATYTHVDNNAPNGTVYYRLTQYDKNGESKVLGVKTVNVGLTSELSVIYPNPLTGDRLFIKAPSVAKQVALVEVIDASGKKIYAKQAEKTTDATFEFKFNGKPQSGVYLIKIDGLFISKLVVN